MTSLTGGRGTGAPAYSSQSTGDFKEKIPKGYGVSTLQQFTPEQLGLFQQLFPHLQEGSYLSRLAGGDESLFQEIEAPALKQFSGLQGGLASRFSGMGGLGARKSSGFQNTANQASSDFAMQLQGQRQGLQRQALSDLMEYSNQLLNQKPYERQLYEKPEKEKTNWGALAGAGIGAAGGFFLGGPAGAFKGAQLGYGVGSSF